MIEDGLNLLLWVGITFLFFVMMRGLTRIPVPRAVLTVVSTSVRFVVYASLAVILIFVDYIKAIFQALGQDMRAKILLQGNTRRLRMVDYARVRVHNTPPYTCAMRHISSRHAAHTKNRQCASTHGIPP